MYFSWYHSIKKDDKGRITIPNDYKNILSESFPGMKLSVTYGFVKQNCLVIHPSEVFDNKLKRLLKIKSIPQRQRTALLHHKRILTKNTCSKKLDRSGKLLIPKELWEKIGITDTSGGIELVISGNDDSMEIWPRADWDTYHNEDAPEDIDVESLLTFDEVDNYED